MKTTHTDFDRLEEPERGIARLAFHYRLDLWDNGRRACTTLASMRRQGRYDEYDLDAIKADIWSASTGTPSPQWEAWECPECGQAYLGQEKALDCCNPDSDFNRQCQAELDAELDAEIEG